MEYKRPHLIDFSKIGESNIGYISVADNISLPFKAERIFWTYYTPENVIRGRHSHYRTEQILIAVTGKIIVSTEDADGALNEFVLDNPSIGVYIPPNVWHTMKHSHTAVQVVLASTSYDAADYIRDFDEFKKVWGNKK